MNIVFVHNEFGSRSSSSVAVVVVVTFVAAAAGFYRPINVNMYVHKMPVNECSQRG